MHATAYVLVAALTFLVVVMAVTMTDESLPTVPACPEDGLSHFEHKTSNVEEYLQALREAGWSNIRIDEKRHWTEVEADCLQAA